MPDIYWIGLYSKGQALTSAWRIIDPSQQNYGTPLTTHKTPQRTHVCLLKENLYCLHQKPKRPETGPSLTFFSSQKQAKLFKSLFRGVLDLWEEDFLYASDTKSIALSLYLWANLDVYLLLLMNPWSLLQFLSPGPCLEILSWISSWCGC